MTRPSRYGARPTERPDVERTEREKGARAHRSCHGSEEHASRAVPPAVRERARARTCPDCRAVPGQKCAPDRAGRSQLHRGRIRDAEPGAAPRRALRPDGRGRCLGRRKSRCADASRRGLK
ncbi:zinc finger domain-containing protein [Streptomyces chrestomyceticus]|uniref:zinc finger domain-containing protein n=1 Tax=Streptomyces chrestomyceticus TaxID=68185 RepID=UPI003F4D042D